jgi:hypothetical protein
VFVVQDLEGGVGEEGEVEDADAPAEGVDDET